MILESSLVPCSSIGTLHRHADGTDDGRRARGKERDERGCERRGAGVWGDTGAYGEHWTALARADAYSRLGKSKIELAREGRQIWSTTNGQRAQALYPCVFH